MLIFSPAWPGSQVNCDFLSVNPNSLNRLLFVCLSFHLSVLLFCFSWCMSGSHTSHWACESRPLLVPQANIKWYIINESFFKWTSLVQFPATSLYVWNSQGLIILLPFFSVLVITTYSISWVACVLKIKKNFLSNLDAVIQMNMLFSEFPPKRYLEHL